MMENKDQEKNGIIVDADLGDEELDNASGGGDWLSDIENAPPSTDGHCPICGECAGEHISWKPSLAQEVLACERGHFYTIHREFEGAYNPDGWK